MLTKAPTRKGCKPTSFLVSFLLFDHRRRWPGLLFFQSLPLLAAKVTVVDAPLPSHGEGCHNRNGEKKNATCHGTLSLKRKNDLVWWYWYILAMSYPSNHIPPFIDKERVQRFIFSTTPSLWSKLVKFHLTVTSNINQPTGFGPLKLFFRKVQGQISPEVLGAFSLKLCTTSFLSRRRFLST